MKKYPVGNGMQPGKHSMRTKLEGLWCLLPQLFDPRALRAMITWPVFSVSAYRLVTELHKQGLYPRTLIDVGANIGQFTIAALNIFKGVTVFSFEPIEMCVEKLRANTSGYSNVHIHAVALGAEYTRASFYVNTYDQASSMLQISHRHVFEFPRAAASKKVDIMVSTLDRFFTGTVLHPPVLLKLDVQGAEKLVLSGGKNTLANVDYVLMESSFSTMYVGEPLFVEMIDIMRELNFRFLRPVCFLRSPKNGEILQADILFKNTENRV
jgi:FkbM family methyltransferase